MGWKCTENRQVEIELTIDANYDNITTNELLAIETAIR